MQPTAPTDEPSCETKVCPFSLNVEAHAAHKRKETFQNYATHISLMAVWQAYIPKHHMVFHLVHKIREQGNPTFYSNWEDESKNSTLKQVCKKIAQATFETSALLRMRTILGGPAPAAKRHKAETAR